ncbi:MULTISPECIES: GGDEF domain-containing protein [Bacillaceae]|uniref:GGDEF domain-containing protein n=1 Tax=Bacillaceae TaxID=186817 RepID=UPI002FFF1433
MKKKQFDSLADLKRGVYLWIVPLIVIALILNTVMQNGYNEYKINFIINNALTIWLFLSWVLLIKRRWVKFIEYSCLALITVYHIVTFFDTVAHYLLPSGGSLGDFIVWMPIYIVFIFLTLGVKKGLTFSIFIFLLTLVDGLTYFNRLSTESMDSLFQYYFANFVYIVVLYYAQHIFKVYAEAQLFKRHAYLDSLTGIANRHQIDGWFEQKLKDSKEMNITFSVIFFDIDHFKMINDQYGHKAGDAILIELADLIQSNLAAREWFGRWGGEEFIILPTVTGQGAINLAELLRETVATHDFQVVGRLTASFGVTEFLPDDTIDSLLSRVDEGLYQSKHRGRNKVSSVS